MAQLLHGDCLEEMKSIDDNSIDLIYCDLPYGQLSKVGCSWDCCIDLNKFWDEVMRIKKINTPIFLTCTTKFGVSLINSAPKKCPFRYDLVWVKSASCGHLSSSKMPMRKHEMIYVFYEKLPFYDISSHKHKFIKMAGDRLGTCYSDGGEEKKKLTPQGSYTPPLPNSIIKDEKYVPPQAREIKYGGKEVVRENTTYGSIKSYEIKERKNGESRYEPPLPNSMLEIKSEKSKHSTQKPVALTSWILKYYSKEGDIVLDATMGSGGMGVSCRDMNRNFIGIEKDDDIYEVACGRIWN